MIAKIVKGSGFREVTGYIIDSKKDARIIAHAGLFIEDVNTITKAFEAQAGMNPKVSRPVGHIALGFSKEDENRLTSRAARRTLRSPGRCILQRWGVRR